VDQEVAVIEQDPFGRIIALYTDWKLAHVLEEFADLISYRLRLPLVCSGTDHEVVREGCDFTQIEDDEISGFFGFGCVGGYQPIRLVSSFRLRSFRDGERGFGARFADLLGSSVLHWKCMRRRSLMLGTAFFLILTFSTVSPRSFAGSSPNSLGSFVPRSSAARKRAEDDVNRTRMLVSQGVLPQKSLADAEAKLCDVKDEDVLARTLYGGSRVQDLSPSDADAMVQAAQRRVDRQVGVAASRLKLVDSGVLARSEAQPAEDELEMRRHALELARNRAKLLHELMTMAQAERALEQARADELNALRPVMIRYSGTAPFNISVDLKTIGDAFSKQFHQTLPISAVGQTLVHQELGFDHRGRVDVGLNPDAVDGLWVRSFLERMHISYIAFRAAVAGSATAPHIHIGPGSMRLKMAPPPDASVHTAHTQLLRTSTTVPGI